MNIIFPKEILTTIFSYTDIKCHVCNKKLSLTLKHIFEKNLTPSIIDLRYKDGVALNYGK